MPTVFAKSFLGLLPALFLLVACEQSPPPPANPAAGDPAALAAAVVAEQLGLSTAEITTVSVEAVDFADSSLGCPAPDMAYMQVITPGHKVAVEADGRRFDVRVAGNSAKICHRRKPAAAPERRPRGENTSQVTREARERLATLLDIAPESIEVARIAPLRAGMALPGCRVDCAADAEDCGMVIELDADGRRYLFHARGGDIAACPPIARS